MVVLTNKLKTWIEVSDKTVAYAKIKHRDPIAIAYLASLHIKLTIMHVVLGINYNKLIQLELNNWIGLSWNWSNHHYISDDPPPIRLGWSTADPRSCQLIKLAQAGNDPQTDSDPNLHPNIFSTWGCQKGWMTLTSYHSKCHTEACSYLAQMAASLQPALRLTLWSVDQPLSLTGLLRK